MTDEKIIDLYWARSEKAIEETDRAYGRYFDSIAYGILKNREDAKETVNDTYLAAWNSMPPERPGHLKAFLGAITRRLSINRAEYNQARKRGGGEYTLVLDELAECVSGGDEPSASLEEKELAALISQFLYTLPLKARAVFVARYFNAMKTEEIAKRYGMREGSVLKTLSRARSKLHIYLTDRGYSV